jgi:hypothetical protein
MLPKLQAGLPDHLGQQILALLALAQPARVVAVGLHLGAAAPARRWPGTARPRAPTVEAGQQMVAQGLVRAGGRIDVHRVQPEAAGLEAVVAVDQVVVLAGREGALRRSQAASACT